MGWTVRGSNACGGEIFRTRSRPTMGPTQPFRQWTPGHSREYNGHPPHLAPKRFAALENFSDSEDINKAWEIIKENIKTSIFLFSFFRAKVYVYKEIQLLALLLLSFLKYFT